MAYMSFCVFAVILVMSTGVEEGKERVRKAGANDKQVAAFETTQIDEIMKKSGVATGFVTAIAAAGLVIRRSPQISVMRDTPRTYDQVATHALELIPACATLAHAPPGLERTRALEEVHEKTRRLADSMTYTATYRGGIKGYMGTEKILPAHVRKVCAALVIQLDGLLDDRDASARSLGRYALSIATAHAQARYRSLLDDADLPPDPAPDSLESGSLVKVFTAGAVGAVVALVVALLLDVSGSAVLFTPLSVFAVVALVAAALTGDVQRITHLLGRVRGDQTNHPNP
ncbi:hypothetical protein ACFWPU_25695 [Streptomyces sp. NPDC058471]|uniref:hypothetical protein n=1 Tax=Streptomyces sp. NPDC058471 TaxID=3346516 RepID=UPI0036651114